MTVINFPKTIDRLLFIVYNIIKIKEREIKDYDVRSSERKQ